MKFLARIHTLTFRKQALIFGGGLSVAWLKHGWSPLDMLGMVVLWYLLVVMVSVIVGWCYHAYFARPEDHIAPENLITIVSMVMFVLYVGMQIYEAAGFLSP